MQKLKKVFRKSVLTVIAAASLTAVLGLGCQQQSKTGGSNDVQVKITVQGDSNVLTGKGASFTAAKGSKWSAIKTNAAITSITFKDGCALSGWKLNNADGTDLTDDYAFNTDTVVFAVSKESVKITVQGDSNVLTGKGASFAAAKGSKWSDVKTNTAITSITFKDGCALSGWKLNNADGTDLTDDYAFNADTVVFAVSKESVKITIHGDDNVLTGKDTSFTADKNITWRALKTNTAITSITFKEGYEISSWKLNDENGAKLVDDYPFAKDTVIFAKTHKKATEVSEGLSMFLSPDKLEIQIIVKTADKADIIVEGCKETSIKNGEETILHAKNANEPVILKGKITYFSCFDNEVLSVNAKGCKNIENINLVKNGLTSFDASGLDKLKYFSISTNKLRSLNLEGCTALEWLICQNNQLSSLDVHSCQNLQYLLGGGNVLTDINVKGCGKLKKLDLGNNQLTKIDTEGCNELGDFFCYNNRLTSVNVKHLAKLKKFNCSTNMITELDVSGMTTITELICKETKLTSLNVQGCKGLQKLFCYANRLAEINVQGLDSLAFLYCGDNQLSGIDIHNLPKLQQLWLAGNKFGAEAFIKVFNDLPDSGGACILYTEKEGYPEKNIKNFSNPPELKTAFDNAKNVKKWRMLKEINEIGATEEI